MEKNSELIDLLREIIREQPQAIAQGGIHIHIHGHIIMGADIGTVTALKMLLRAHESSRDDPALSRIKLVP